MEEYRWGERFFPYFYPAEDEQAGDGFYVVEFSLTCYPYANGSRFDADAFPEELEALGRNGNTKFFFLAHDDDGTPLSGLDWDEACEAADDLNGAYEDILDECSDTWEWDRVGYDIRRDDCLYWK